MRARQPPPVAFPAESKTHTTRPLLTRSSYSGSSTPFSCAVPSVFVAVPDGAPFSSTSGVPRRSKPGSERLCHDESSSEISSPLEPNSDIRKDPTFAENGRPSSGSLSQIAQLFASSYTPPARARQQTVGVLSKSRGCYPPEGLLKNNQGIPTDSQVFSRVRGCYAQVGGTQVAQASFNEMISRGIVPSVTARNWLLAALVMENYVHKARCLYNEMRQRGMNFDCFTIDIVMQACLKEGNDKDAERYFEEMTGSGLKPDVVVFHTIIKIMCRRPDSRRASELLDQMKSLGFIPSATIYTWVISAYVKEGNMIEALRLKDEMVANGWPMNVVVETSLMKGYCVQGDIDAAMNIFSVMVEHGIVPNNVTYSVLIDGCCNSDSIGKAYELYVQMRQKGIIPISQCVYCQFSDKVFAAKR